MQNPKVSVLIPTYNYGHFLSEAINSVLIQTYQDFELIIVDNCSTDNTEEIVNNYAKNDARIKFMRNPENIGMYRNYNQALLLAQGEYIKFLNADDKFEPTLLEKFVRVLDNDKTISVVTSYRQYFGSKNDILKSPLKGKLESTTVIFSSLKKGNWIGEPTTVMFRRENLNLGLFDISLLMIADQDMWLRHMRVGSLYIIDEVLSYFRIHENQGTAELNADTDKQFFNRLQYADYRRSSILNKRFGYDLSEIDWQKTKQIFTASYRGLRKLITHRPNSLKSFHEAYGIKISSTFLLIGLIPTFILSLFHMINKFRKKLKYGR